MWSNTDVTMGHTDKSGNAASKKAADGGLDIDQTHEERSHKQQQRRRQAGWTDKGMTMHDDGDVDAMLLMVEDADGDDGNYGDGGRDDEQPNGAKQQTYTQAIALAAWEIQSRARRRLR